MNLRLPQWWWRVVLALIALWLLLSAAGSFFTDQNVAALVLALLAFGEGLFALIGRR